MEKDTDISMRLMNRIYPTTLKGFIRCFSNLTDLPMYLNQMSDYTRELDNMKKECVEQLKDIDKLYDDYVKKCNDKKECDYDFLLKELNTNKQLLEELECFKMPNDKYFDTLKKDMTESIKNIIQSVQNDIDELTPCSKEIFLNRLKAKKSYYFNNIQLKINDLNDKITNLKQLHKFIEDKK